MYRLAVITLLLGSVVGCGGRSPARADGRPAPVNLRNQLADIAASYRRLGRLASTGALPFVGSVVFAAAPGDSVMAILGLSFENQALSFQREENTFIARYRVSLAFRPAQGRSVELSREEIVRVATFPETQRTDESVLFQQALRLAPGSYRVTVTVRDLSSTSEGRAEQEFTAPTFESGTTSAPILIYQATGRATPADPVGVVLNSRGVVAYGADTLLAYVEGYGFSGPTTVPFEVRDDRQNVVFRDSLRFSGTRAVESQVLRLAPDTVTLGALQLAVGRTGRERSGWALVSFSQAWVATNFEEVVDMLRYFGHHERVRALRGASAPERSRRWREFYRDTDPDKSTAENEALRDYFSRIAAANKLFADEGVPGWQTDRGEVYIGLGPPDETAETAPGRARVMRWNYLNHRLTLYFQDESGFGRLRLTPGSRSEFERALSRIQRQAP